MSSRTALIAVTVASGALAAASPAAAFHHVGVPASTCGQGEWSGGNNPMAKAALIAHNPAQTLPLPPVGVTSAPVEAPAVEICDG
jgi:hypothetical protein